MIDLKKRTTLTLTRGTVEQAQSMGLNLSAIADAAIAEAVRKARREAWAKEHAAALRAQDDWIDRHGHPFADIMEGPFAKDFEE
jgi:antitoxin CcdA